ncbi:polyhydroxyalkanoic acid system family protein [Massilia sp. H6]|uniref:polyhydroxyalkanoic acid system family protein n=1 Tax=Massilia sp. H6 TaxID=2970464 RepID=UPI002169B97C|nr:polyhydroxyalkanoic acid system family protein [Massilia sp. H6]UVW29655.1 polyhydroxyalkanoic acid system family protein [Massilia sp. H6]
MSEISIVQEHNLSAEQARAAAQQVAQRISTEYGLECIWDGDVLRFERSGVEGALTLDRGRAALQIRLGFFMSAFASAIEAKVAEKMRKVFVPA